jgi:hypothetical protein
VGKPQAQRKKRCVLQLVKLSSELSITSKHAKKTESLASPPMQNIGRAETARRPVGKPHGTKARPGSESVASWNWGAAAAIHSEIRA